MIEHLAWDSNFFGFPVGKFVLNQPELFSLDAFCNAAASLRLVYLFSPKPLSHDGRLKLADVKLTYQTYLNQMVAPVGLQYFNERIHDKQTLLELAYASGIYSRFRTDTHFQAPDFYRMYDAWVKRSLEADDSKVLVETIDNKLLGFVTLDFVSQSQAAIGLIAVSEASRGAGVGSRLLQQAARLCNETGRKQIRVATQEENKPASAFYLRNGYELAERMYIYHYWNL